MQTTPAPNTGRILDYWLGGTHHYPEDVVAAETFSQLFPTFPSVFRTLRCFIGRASQAIADQGIDQFVVFGAGVPTQGNVHEAVPRARVLYTDIDSANIELGRGILADAQHIGYTYCDVRDIGMLEPAVVEAVLGPVRRLGIVVIGVAAFLSDSELRQSLQALYDWAPPDSFLALDCDGEALLDHPAVLDILAQAGEPLNLRSPEQIRPLLGNWQLSDDGIRPVQRWRCEAPPPEAVFMYGCLAHKAPASAMSATN